MSEQPYHNAGASAPVVVQGVLVNNNNNNNGTQQQQHIYDHNNVSAGIGAMHSRAEAAPTFANSTSGGDWSKGEVQPRQCNDAVWALAYYVHLGLMGWAAGSYAPRMFSDVSNANYDRALQQFEQSGQSGQFNEFNELDQLDSLDSLSELTELSELSWPQRAVSSLVTGAARLIRSEAHAGQRWLQEEDYEIGTNDFGDLMLLLGVSAIVALVISTLALSFMISHAQFLIKFALMFNIAATAVFAIGALFVSPFAAIMGIMLASLTIYYAYVVWGRIPFAACNLVSATTAVRANFGLAFLAYSTLVLMFGWSVWWMVTFVSTVYVSSGCNAQGVCDREASGWLVFALALSYHWTFQVIKNTLHVTVAGTVGTWWFAPTEASSCCSNGVRDSFVRSVTSAFGSICLGSLLVAIIEASKQMVRNLRESEDGGGIFLCLAECLLACLQDILEYFNTWAFVFVGLYGYTFLEAGKNVINLFKTRGWTTIITDNLAQGVLTMVSAGVGLITGLVSLLVAHGQGIVFGDEIGGAAASFFVGFVIGMVLTSTLMTIVSSAVNTVIVCYAEAPQEFQTNHPQLSEEMRAAWRQAWPVEFHY